MNNNSLGGRLTADPELRYTANNQTPVARITLACARDFKKEGQPDADFIPVEIWGKQAENCANTLSKGDYVEVVGSIKTSSFDDQEGKRHFTWCVVARGVKFIIVKKWANGKPANNEQQSDFYPAEEDDDLPF